MNLSDLQSRGLVIPFEPSPEHIATAIKNADKNLISADKMMAMEEWGFAHTAAYNAMLHAGRALMFFKGQKPANGNHHVAIVSFCSIYEKKYTAKIIKAFDQGRKRRHEFHYDDVDSISKDQAMQLIKIANDFVSVTKQILKI